MCPFEQNNLNAWSLLSWNPKPTYLWERLSVLSKFFALIRHSHVERLPHTYIPLRETLSFVKVICSSPSRSRQETRIMSIEALLFNGFGPSRSFHYHNQPCPLVVACLVISLSLSLLIKIHKLEPRVRFFAFIPRDACAPGSRCTTLLETVATRMECGVQSSRNKWIFGSEFLLCQDFRRMREETAWKRIRM